MININFSIEYWQVICFAVFLLLAIALWKFNKLLAIKIRVKECVDRLRTRVSIGWSKISNWWTKLKNNVKGWHNRVIKKIWREIKIRFKISKYKWLYIGLIIFFVVNEMISIFYEFKIIR